VARTRAARWREESSETVVFAGGEGAPVVVVKCDEVLQLGRGKGVRKLQEILRIGDSGRSSSRNGGWWRRSAEIRAREGLSVAEGGDPGAGSDGGKVWRSRGGAREEWVMEERTAFRTRFETAGRRRNREGKREGEVGTDR
jgi:hypothetical protein